MKRLKLTSAIMASIAGMSSPTLFAQSEDDLNTFFLEEVVVTAQRRAETLQDAAIPINAATGDQLIKAGISDASGLGRISPALTVNSGGGANTGYFVRGAGNFNNNGYTNPAVAFNMDGVYMGRPSSTISSFMDLDRVEVLKGPQGTLYGRNATAGAINVIPKKPILGENSGSISLEAGNYGKAQVTGAFNAAAGDNSAFRVAATFNQLDGWFDDDTGEIEDTAVRAQFFSELSDTFNYRVSADWSNAGGTGPGIDVFGIYSFAPRAFGGGPISQAWTFNESPSSVGEYSGLHSPDTLAFIESGAGVEGFNGATAAPLFNPVSGYAYPSRDDTHWGVSGEFNFDLGFGDLVVIPAYRYSELDNVFNGPPFKAAINQDEAKQTSFEARLSGETDSFQWILGAYYFDENVKGDNSFNQFSTLSINSWDSNVESSALFARGTWSISDSTRLVGGIRYTTEDRSMDAQAFAIAAVCLDAAGPVCNLSVPTIPVANTLDEMVAAYVDLGALPPGTTFPGPPAALNFDPEIPGPPGAILAVRPDPIDESVNGEDEVTYRVAVEQDLSDDSLLYFSYETGFRAGGFNLSAGRETYDAEFLDAFTIGSKNRFMGNRLELNVEAFMWEYEDQILAALGTDINGNNSFYARNVGDSTTQGVEVDFQFLAAENTLIRGGVQFLDSEYDSFAYNQVDLSDDETGGADLTDPAYFLTPLTGCENTQVLPADSTAAVSPGDVIVTGDTRSFNVDCSGEEALFAPETSINFGLDQTFPLSAGKVVASLDVRYRAERWVGFGYLDAQRAEDVTTIDASISYEGDSGLRATLYGRNITDEYILSTSQVGAGSVAGGNVEPPATYGVRIQYDF